MDVDGVKVHSTGDEYDNGRAGNVGETAASGSGSANTNEHLGYVVGRISPAGVATTRQINDWSGSRDVIGLATQGGVSRSIRRVVESTTTGPETLMIPVSTGYLKTLWDVAHGLGRSPLTKPTVRLGPQISWSLRSRKTMSQSIRRSMGSTTKGPVTFGTLYHQVQLSWLTWNP